MQETSVLSLGLQDPLEKGMTIHFRFLPGKSCGQRRLVGYNPWGPKELGTTEQLTLSLSLYFNQRLESLPDAKHVGSRERMKE